MVGKEAVWWRATGQGCELLIRVVTGARRSEIADATGDILRVRLAAPAVEGKANDELIRFFAEWFDVRLSAVEIVSGAKSRTKRVRVVGRQAPPDTTMF